MATPEGYSRHSWSGSPRRPAPRGSASDSQATILGSLTIAGRPEQVSVARAFVSRTLSAHQIETDSDAATLLTSEIVTNAVAHTKSGVDGGTVTIVVIGIPHGVLVEVIDSGSAATPVVKGDLYADDGHGLFLVQHLAAQWGYLRDPAGTTVWFHLAAAGSSRASEQASPQVEPQAAPPPAAPPVLPQQQAVGRRQQAVGRRQEGPVQRWGVPAHSVIAPA